MWYIGSRKKKFGVKFKGINSSKLLEKSVLLWYIPDKGEGQLKLEHHMILGLQWTRQLLVPLAKSHPQ